MKTKTFIIILFNLLAINLAFAENTVTSEIKSVTIYPDRALVKRQAGYDVKKGENIIKIAGLSPFLEENSVQVKVDNNVKILDIKTEKTFLQKLSLDKIELIKNNLENIKSKITSYEDEISAINASIDFLKKVSPFPANQKVIQNEIDSYTKFIENSLLENFKRVANLQKSIYKLEEEKEALENELNNSHLSLKESKGVILHLLSDKNRTVDIELSYVTSKVGWSPLYDIKADSVNKTVNISAFALITQNTGEDFKDVDVEISTAKPTIGVIPEILPWYIDIYTPPVYKSMKSEDFLAKRSDITELQVIQEAESQIKTEATSFSFLPPVKQNIPSDNQPHRILLGSASTDGDFKYYAVPKHSPFAYLRADVKNPLEFPILRGQMNIFLDNRFVSKMYIKNTILPLDKVNISFGADESIKAEKKLVKNFTEYEGVFSKTVKVSYDYEITISNGKKRQIDIDIKDNIPVSKNEKIKVTVAEPKNEDEKFNEDGIIVWSLKLNPDEKKVLKVTFQIEYPKDASISGLE